MTPEHDELDHDELDNIASAIWTANPTGSPAVLVGWVAVAEFMDSDGHRWLMVRSGTAPDADHQTTSWQRRGYMHEVLEANWLDQAGTDFTEDEPE
jgi:hypothetical protein